jgi:hypothetical protein
MQYQVPQFIETEDKVVGPFSLRQFAFVGVAALISGICYFLLQTWLFVVVALILIGGALALSFIKINGRPLMKIALSAFNFYWKPQLYVWKPDHPVVTQPQPHPHPAEPAPEKVQVRELPPIKTIALGNSLHKSWENLQTGTPIKKTSDRQFIEKKMAERYQIFQRESGERTAARRVDYR